MEPDQRSCNGHPNGLHQVADHVNHRPPQVDVPPVVAARCNAAGCLPIMALLMTVIVTMVVVMIVVVAVIVAMVAAILFVAAAVLSRLHVTIMRVRVVQPITVPMPS